MSHFREFGAIHIVCRQKYESNDYRQPKNPCMLCANRRYVVISDDLKNEMKWQSERDSSHRKAKTSMCAGELRKS